MDCIWGCQEKMPKLRIYILSCAIMCTIGALIGCHLWFLETFSGDARFVEFMRGLGRGDLDAIVPENAEAVGARGEELDLGEFPSSLRKCVNALALERGTNQVELTIDARLQRRALELMRGRRGAVVAVEPCTGKIRALASSPKGENPHRALWGLYPPGSTFKVFMGAAALSEGLEPVFNCPAEGWRSAPSTPPIRDVEARVAERKGRRWRGFGRIGMDEALVHSSNTYFAQLGKKLGPEAFARAMTASKLRDGFTLMQAGGSSVDSAGCGVPDGLSAPQLAPVAIGQGALQFTPLAVAMFTAAVADDGLLLEPRIAADGKPALRARPFTQSAATRMRSMMRAAVSRGTGRACDLAGLQVCGKTGTAQTGGAHDHAWFTCFAPIRSPRLVVTVLVEHGGIGADSALPIAREVLGEARKLGYFR